MLRNIKNHLKPVSFKEYKKILNENLKSKKYNCLILSGAEVTMNKNLIKFVSYAKNLGIFKHIRIQTNGRRLSYYDYCKYLINAGVDEFFVSIYGHNQKIHNSITQVRSSFTETLQGIENLNKLGASIITNTTVTRLNYKFLPDIVKKLSSFGNIYEMQFWNYWPMGKRDKNNLIESHQNIKPYLLEALKEAKKRKILIIIKNFPECLLGRYKISLDNSQPDTIIDESYWEKFFGNYDLNKFGKCLFKDICKSKKCSGLITAYIKKFGWDEDILYPIKNQSDRSVKSGYNNQIKKYIFHKKMFGIKDTSYLKLFENLLNVSQDYRLECSCRIEGDNIHPIRFNVWYGDKNHVRNINSIFNFFKKIAKCSGITINYDIIKKIFDRNFDLEKIEQTITGIDYRGEINESRLKMWFIIKNYSEKIKQVLSVHGCGDDVLDLIVDNELLFGFDFYFDGRTNIKIYPHFDQIYLKDATTLKKLRNTFSSKIFDLIGQCDEMYVSFRGGSSKKILHLHPSERGSFVKKLNNKKLEEISNLIKNNNFGDKGVISLCENEIDANPIKNVNIYY